ncbi:MerR family transcriptional regulator [Luedemannella helvata]|uniref:HTH merR-type domain-containing protein n=1 Tax=Luedemannella helvata TaxID=349315 RepID=A0ABP4WXB8_9ACTN
MSGEGPRYTVEELAAKVGMSPRNIRAHQTRSLLGPPIRRGRTAYYDDSHVRRLEAIKALQRQGYNLVAIEAILGVRAPEPVGEALQHLLQRLDREQPGLVHALARHGVLVRGDDGSVQMLRVRLMRSALGLNRAGVHAVPSLQVLSEVLDRLRLIAEDLVRSTSQRLVSATPSLRAGPTGTWDELDVRADALAISMIGLLTEAFRVALENFGTTAMPDLIAECAGGGQLYLTGSATIDNG